jgi:hypothetical protein
VSTPWWFADANLTSDRSAWDTVQWNDTTLPGLGSVKVTAGVAHKIDVRASAGSDGWTFKEKGQKPAEFTVNLRIWEEAHWTTWEAFSQSLTARLRDGSQRMAIKIGHPVLIPLNIRRAYLEEVGGVEQVQVGLWTVSLRMHEFRPPRRNASGAVVPWAVTPPPATPAAVAADTRIRPFSPAALERALPASRLDGTLEPLHRDESLGPAPMNRDMGPDRLDGGTNQDASF